MGIPGFVVEARGRAESPHDAREIVLVLLPDVFVDDLETSGDAVVSVHDSTHRFTHSSFMIERTYSNIVSHVKPYEPFLYPLCGGDDDRIAGALRHQRCWDTWRGK